MRRRSIVAGLILGLAGCASQAIVLSQNDATAVAQAEAYLQRLTSFHARFVQTGADGTSDGEVWLARPGRLRVDYQRPKPRLLLAHDGRLLVLDQATGARTTLPVSNTPLDILLAGKIDFSGAVTVTHVQRVPGALQVSVIKTGRLSEGQLTLQFGDDPLRLLAVVIQDGNGRSNTLSLSDLDPDVAIDPSRFVPPSPAS